MVFSVLCAALLRPRHRACYTAATARASPPPVYTRRMPPLDGKRIVLGVGGGIAAYKIPDLARRLNDAGADVRAVMSESAAAFITPLTLQAVTGHPVTAGWPGASGNPAGGDAMEHISLARWADLVIVAPATANLMARLAAGAADDPVAALCLATEAPLIVAPAMNVRMWAHPATRANALTLQANGAVLVGPARGTQACGEFGDGRMSEAAELTDAAAVLLSAGAASLAGLRVMVTAGPTYEPLDAVRGLTNRSSGKMGRAVAAAAIAAGARTTLINGPGTPPPPPAARVHNITTGREMLAAVESEVDAADIFIGVAAVADFRPGTARRDKMKRGAISGRAPAISLAANPDIIKTVAARDPAPFTVGFAAETGDLVRRARAKLRAKKLDLVCANRISDAIGGDSSALTVVGQDGAQQLGPGAKTILARQLMAIVARRYHAKHPG